MNMNHNRHIEHIGFSFSSIVPYCDYVVKEILTTIGT